MNVQVGARVLSDSLSGRVARVLDRRSCLVELDAQHSGARPQRLIELQLLRDRLVEVDELGQRVGRASWLALQ